jgi:hypothetical protein
MGLGGAILNGFGSALTVADSEFEGNRAAGGSGSSAWGGAIGNIASNSDSANSSAAISDSTFVHNEAVGGAGGSGLGGALFNGGTAQFGSDTPFTLTMTVSDCTLADNRAVGGAGGNGLGGGLFNGLGTSTAVPTVTLSNTEIHANRAVGGAGGSGIGGGIYTTGTALVHKVVVKGNEATTSNDDVFGPLTPF